MNSSSHGDIWMLPGNRAGLQRRRRRTGTPRVAFRRSRVVFCLVVLCCFVAVFVFASLIPTYARDIVYYSELLYMMGTSKIQDFVVDVDEVPYRHQNNATIPPYPSQVPTLQEAIAYYKYTQGKDPPRLYRKWYEFAVSRRCNILGYSHLSKQLGHLPEKITPEMIMEASKLEKTTTLIIRPLPGTDDPNAGYTDNAWADGVGQPLETPSYVFVHQNRQAELLAWPWKDFLGPFAKYFPRNFRVVLNDLDEPRIHLPNGKCQAEENRKGHSKRGWVPNFVLELFQPPPPIDPSTTVANATNITHLTKTAPQTIDLNALSRLDLHNPFQLTLAEGVGQHHGFFYRPHTMPSSNSNPLPIFSSAVLPDCYADMVVPLIYALYSCWDQVSYQDRAKADMPFVNKTATAVWRGRTTGGMTPANVTFWDRMHRHRLVKYSMDIATNTSAHHNKSQQADLPLVDARFMGYVQEESPAAVRALERVFGRSPWRNSIPYKDLFGFRYLIDTDGNTFSSRFHTFLRESRSLILRARAFVDWTDHWARPYAHYIPLDTDWSDLLSAVRWAREHPAESEIIAERAFDLGRRGLRWEDAQCHMFAVMAEYEDRLVGRGTL
ncbi:glycosyltransferase family 90 protein [Gonapodya prolifera JEL478]|uniref:Glycosyltransferase family 90 protein n=1 Tax=Gonapodya prolifera (strain JEL478) TaxID=1344416 RepID=A0A139AUZ3_GONPJ|nr:glycosyltransferase family 90 protein [Gonapodya prolifera JEL478]|eukprot:KXS20403.1 glycosyltransferase family 90 protein [Gonapodya prolifera JEL478]